MTYGLILSFILAFSFNTFAQNAPAKPAAAKPAPGDDVVVATIGARKLTKAEFMQKYNDVKARAVNAPTKEQFLEDLIRYEVGVQEAEKRGMEKDPIVQDLIKQSLYKSLLEKELGDNVQKITVSDKEMQDYYKRNPQIRFSHILIATKIGASTEEKAEAKKRADEINKEVAASKRPFEELVKLYSDDSLSKQAGGDVSWQSRNTIAPNVYETVVKMNVGDIRGVIETQYGFHIIKVTGRRSYDNANKRDIRAAVFDEKRKQIFDDYFARLKRSYAIKSNPSALN